MPYARALSPFLLALALSVPCLAEGPNTLTARERAEGWKLLFDGETMAGWRDPARKNPPGDAWTIEDGCLKANPGPRIMEDLVSAGTYENFDLRFEWRISPGGNSGVKYRIQDLIFLAPGKFPKFEDQVDYSLLHRPAARPAQGQEYVIGFEYQVIDNGHHEDALRGAKYQAAGLYDLVGPVKDQTRPVGEFNEGRIVLRGDRVEHWLNGVKVVDIDLSAAARGASKRWGESSPVYGMLAKQPRRNCPLSLQNHNDAAWFRNLRVRRLP